METVLLARQAMATRFELELHGPDHAALRAAGEAALDEVARLEARLSLFRPGSEIAQINARAAQGPVPTSPEVFSLLQQAARLTAETGGAFDITIAPLVRCWGFMGANGGLPTAGAVAAARELVGMHHVLLDPQNRTVRFARDGVMLDLGALGKGYAVERAVELLREAGVTSALIHGGTSTVCALGHPPAAKSWTVAIEIGAESNQPPLKLNGEQLDPDLTTSPGSNPSQILNLGLCNESLSVSSVSGRQFTFGGKLFGHVIDPQSGHPTEAARLAAVSLPSATETDALSTGLLTLGPAGLSNLSSSHPNIKALVVCGSGSGCRAFAHGFEIGLAAPESQPKMRVENSMHRH